MDEWLMQGIPRTIVENPDMETVRRIRASITSDTGQVVESDLLLPCPFCGARPYIQIHELDETCVEARVVCPSCHVSTTREYQGWRVWHGDDELTRTLAIGRAISCWNRRAERTCLWNGGCGLGVYLGPYDEDTGAYDLPSTIEAHHLTCGHTAYTEEEIPSYCPHCGARVMEED